VWDEVVLPYEVRDRAAPQCAEARGAVLVAQRAVLTAAACAAQAQPFSAVEPAAQDVRQELRAAALHPLVLSVLVQMRLWPVPGKEQLTKCTDLFEP
jgi:hypothetical protein